MRACLAIRGCTTPLTSLFSLIFFGSTLDHFVSIVSCVKEFLYLENERFDGENKLKFNLK